MTTHNCQYPYHTPILSVNNATSTKWPETWTGTGKCRDIHKMAPKRGQEQENVTPSTKWPRNVDRNRRPIPIYDNWIILPIFVR